MSVLLLFREEMTFKITVRKSYLLSMLGILLKQHLI